MRVAEFLTQYEFLSDGELLRLAAERDTLVQEAQQALDCELSRRHITRDEIENEKADVASLQRQVELQAAAATWVIPNLGIGKTFYGRRNRRVTASREEYDSTLWVVLLWFPLIPLGTFRLRRAARKSRLGWMVRRPAHAADRKARDWNQILLTWLCAVSVAFAIRIAWHFLPALLFRIH